MEGLEPAHLSEPDPKSGVSTNFTTPANLFLSQLSLKSTNNWINLILIWDAKIKLFFLNTRYFKQLASVIKH